MTSNPATASKSTPSPPPIGSLVTVGSRRLFVHQAGTGPVPIIFLPGAGTIGLDYFAAFEGASRLTTTVVYDRAGTGWSDDAPLPRSPDEVTDELRALLAVLDLAPPVILAGHSLGGGYAQHYARRYPTEVGALVLLDPAHQDYPRYEPPALTASASASAEAMAEWVPPAEVLEQFAALFAEKFAEYPEAIRVAVIEYHRRRWRTGLLESSNVASLYPAFAAAPPMPEIPLLVLTALSLDPGTRLFMPDALQQQVLDGKRQLHAAIVASAPHGAERLLPDASHSWMAAERPDAVVAALHDVLAQVEARRT